MNFTHYTCANGFAKPVNPFDYDSTVEYTAYERFAIFAKENTVSCSEDLSGEYAVELFDSPVVEWCIHVPMGHAFWAKTTQEIADKWNDDFPNNKRKTRQYLQLKPVVKEEKPKVRKSYTGITDALFDQYEKDTINEYVMVNSFHCECPKCGEKYDVTPADGTAINKKVKQPEVKQEFGEWISVLSECKRVQHQYRNCKEGTNGAGVYNGLAFAIDLIQKALTT